MNVIGTALATSRRYWKTGIAHGADSYFHPAPNVIGPT